MTSHIILPSLSSWTQSHLTALLQANTPETLDEAFNAYVATQVEAIYVNGEKLTRDEFRTHLQSSRSLYQTAEVNYLGVVEAKSETEGEKAGNVGIFLETHIQDQTASISFNLKIIQDPSITPPHTPIHGHFDPRRVSALTSVSTNAIGAPHSHPLIPAHNANN